MNKKPDVISTRRVEFSNNGILDFLTGAPAPKQFLDNLRRDISKSKRRHQDISIVTVKFLSKTGWRCSSDQITVSISSNILPIVSFPVLSNVIGSQISINAIVGATSEVAGN